MTDKNDKKCEGTKGYCDTQKKYEDTIEERDNKKDALSVEEQAKVKTGEDDMCLGEGVYGEEVEGKEKDCKKDCKKDK